ncbi:glycerophosphoryl diester phosphodiesterase [Geodermatophilus amargosae]|uniref:Glycerophosphoryl diester phosphodiesterase n=1 Tax=Geodermatophilus amargosae TaxID=1296565 RepID=A0A1I7CBR0_9ACTN|nr:glycerophosphodiester phosphodiesterase [Geodermatophilus amargosae]SFT96861.1 glycerophosphoryl diester phosphodiesterase [Geodermatophilus amargosae]
MRIVGHRGTPSCPQRAENTLPSIRVALEAGADGVEVDVQATSDGVLVLAHDPDLSRVLGLGPGTGPVVGQTPFAALRELRLPNGECIPTLTEALDVAARWHAFIVTEVKPEAGGAAAARAAGLLAGLLHARRVHRPGVDRVTTTSFDLHAAASLAGCGSVSGALIVAPHVDPDVAARRARDRGLTDVHLNPVHVRRDRDVVHRVRGLGLLVSVGVVNDPDEARLMTRLGVDMICTDDPIGFARLRTSAVLSGIRGVERAAGGLPVTTLGIREQTSAHGRCLSSRPWSHEVRWQV